MVSIQPSAGAGVPRNWAPRGGAALAVSILLHAMLILALIRLGQPADRPQSPAPATIVWLGEIRTERPAQSHPAETQSHPLETQAHPAETQAHPAQLQSRPAAQSSTAQTKPRSAETKSRPRAKHSAAQAPPGSAGTAVQVDLEALRQHVIERLVARQARIGGISTSSSADAVGKGGPQDPDAWRAVWTAAFAGRVAGGCDGCGEPSLLHAGQQRTGLGRLAAGLCHGLLGGGNFFGLFNLCGSYDSGPDLDSPIRPEYLKKRPLCGEIAPQQLADARAAGADSIPSVKCRLVDETERQAITKATAAK
jgi:hypothetical protein